MSFFFDYHSFFGFPIPREVYMDFIHVFFHWFFVWNPEIPVFLNDQFFSDFPKILSFLLTFLQDPQNTNESETIWLIVHHKQCTALCEVFFWSIFCAVPCEISWCCSFLGDASCDNFQVLETHHHMGLGPQWNPTTANGPW